MRFSPSQTCCGCVLKSTVADLQTEVFVNVDTLCEPSVDGSEFYYVDGGQSTIGTLSSFAYMVDPYTIAVPWVARIQAAMWWPADAGKVAARLIGAWLDCDNYAYVEVEFETRGTEVDLPESPDTKFWQLHLRLVDVTNGTKTTLAFIDGDLIRWSSLMGKVPRLTETYNPLLTLCWDGTNLSGAVYVSGVDGGSNVESVFGYGQFARVMQANNWSPNGTQFGAGTGELNTGDEVRFWGFWLAKSVSEAQPDCDACATNCCDGCTPATLDMEITDAAGVVDASAIYADATFDCAQLNVTLVGAWVDETWTTYGEATAQDRCLWVATFPVEIIVPLGMPPVPTAVPATMTVTARVTRSLGVGTPTLYVDATIYGLGWQHTFAAWSQSLDGPCESLALMDWTPATPTGGHLCGSPSLSFKFSGQDCHGPIPIFIEVPPPP